MKKKMHLFIFSFSIIFVVAIIGIAYSAFSQNLAINDITSSVRIIKDIRITGVSVSNFTSNVISVEDYNVSNISANLILPNSNSSITYKVQVTNIGNAEAGIYDITGLPSNLEYSIDNYDLKNKICDDNNKCSLGINKDIYITIKYKNGGYNSSNTSYNFALNFDFKKIYNVSYINIRTNNYPMEVIEGEKLDIEFQTYIPTTLKITGSDTYTYNKPNLSISNISDDVVIESLTEGETIAYNYYDAYNFTGSNYLNTNIRLYNQANINKNYRITFNIDSYGSSQTSLATLMNSVNESGSPWPGVLARIESNNTLRIESNKQGQSIDKDNNISTVKKVEIIRVNNILYYKLNDGNYALLQDFNGFTSYFNVPVTFGGSLDGSSKPYRYFKGTLSNMEVRFLDNEVDSSYYIPKLPDYEYQGQYTFSGSNNINTGISLFNKQNFDKDFELSFNINSLGSNGNNQETLVNSIYETTTSSSSMSDYPGFAMRIEGSNYIITANGDESYVTIPTSRNITSVKFIRENKILYYQLNGGEVVKFYDYNNGKTVNFDTPVTFGSSLNSSGSRMREFKGTLSNMVIVIK